MRKCPLPDGCVAIIVHTVLKMFLAKGKIMPDMIVLLDKWWHTGFNVLKKAGADDKIPGILTPELSTRAFRRNWARLIQKIGACPPFVTRFLSALKNSRAVLRAAGLFGRPGPFLKECRVRRPFFSRPASAWTQQYSAEP